MHAESENDFETAAIAWFTLGTYRMTIGYGQNNSAYRKDVLHKIYSR